MSNVAERFEVDGLKVKICWEEDARFADPRDCDNLGTMVCWHPDYILGDAQLGGSGGAVDNLFTTENGRSDFSGMEAVERYLSFTGALCIMPLYLLDHSGLSIRAGSPSPFDSPKVRADHRGAAMGFDTTMVGFIYTTRERIAELCGDAELDIQEALNAEVKEYNSWLSGEVYYYVVEDEDGEILDSCGGFIGSDHVMSEARAAAEWEARQKALDAEPDLEAALAAARVS